MIFEFMVVSWLTGRQTDWLIEKMNNLFKGLMDMS